jgi:hypothetical protein
LFRFFLYLKLFVVMGINWVAELISFMCGGPQEIWYLPDIANTLQGVFIFVIFVCKRRILGLVKGRCRRRRRGGCEGRPGVTSIKAQLSTRSHSNTTSMTTMPDVIHHDLVRLKSLSSLSETP